MSQSRGGSTDPLIHAAANAASSDAHHQHQHPSSPFGNTSDSSRKRSAAAAMLDASAGQGGNGGPDSPPRYSDGADASNMGHDSEGRAQMSSLSGYGLNWEEAAAAAAAAAAAGEADNGQVAASGQDQPGYYGQYTQSHDAGAQGAGSSSNVTSAAGNAGGSNKRRSTRRGSAAAAGSTDSNNGAGGATSTDTSTAPKSSLPYARSPELRVSHKLAERKRRKEMKDLFDNLKKSLPDPAQDGGASGSNDVGGGSAKDRNASGKLSKWEVLSRAHNHIQWLESCKTKLLEEVDRLREQSGMPPMPFELPAYPQAEPVSAGLGGDDDVSKDAQMADEGHDETMQHHAGGHEEHHHHHQHHHHGLHSEHDPHQQQQHHEHEHAHHHHEHDHGDGQHDIKDDGASAMQQDASAAGNEIQAAMNMFKTAAAAQAQQQQQQAQAQAQAQQQ